MQRGDPKQVAREAVPASQTSTASGGNVNASTVRDSPLNGRDWTQLAALQAGVTAFRAEARKPNADSAPPSAFPEPVRIRIATRLDGISINDYANGAPGSVLGSNLGVDAVEQFFGARQQTTPPDTAALLRSDQCRDALRD